MYNHTGLQGRLTATPELRYTPSGTAITSFTLASDTGRKTKDGNRITNFIDCVAWRQQAEYACKYLTKGRLVIVDGELTSRTYPDPTPYEAERHIRAQITGKQARVLLAARRLCRVGLQRPLRQERGHAELRQRLRRLQRPAPRL